MNYEAKLLDPLPIDTGKVYLDKLPARQRGYLEINPDDPDKREVVRYVSIGAQHVELASSPALGSGFDGHGRGLFGTEDRAHDYGTKVVMFEPPEEAEQTQGQMEVTYPDGTTVKLLPFALSKSPKYVIGKKQ